MRQTNRKFRGKTLLVISYETGLNLGLKARKQLQKKEPQSGVGNRQPF